MPIFQIHEGSLEAVTPTTFGAEGIYERKHIQALLRDNIDVLGERLLVLGEEFGDWLDSSRRIDLLCLDQSANIVVVELKRTEDGGHMELQAVRYAAMVSTMTFDQAAETLARRLNRALPDISAARSAMLEFLDWEEVYEDRFGDDTRIILAAADFAKELTTAVMWLIERGIDIRCIRLKPYRLNDGPVLLDIQQLIPLPEAASFQTQIGVKRQAARQGRTERHDLRQQWWARLIQRPDAELHRHITPSAYGWIGASSGVRGLNFNYVVYEDQCGVELYIDRGKGAEFENKAIFDQLLAHRSEIEAQFGGALLWQRLDAKRAARIRVDLDGGYRSAESDWDEAQRAATDAMRRLHDALQARLRDLKLGT